MYRGTFFIFILFELYYYFDFRESRKLTYGERNFLETIYANTVDYEKVKIYSEKFFPNPIQPDNVAMSPNGNVYFSEKYYSNDFSKLNISKQAWLVHEIMHVKQYQNENQWFAWKSAILDLKGMFGILDPYAYKVDFNKKLNDYNYEQQGDIARDYFLYLNGVKKLTKNEIEWYEKVLGNKK